MIQYGDFGVLKDAMLQLSTGAAKELSGLTVTLRLWSSTNTTSTPTYSEAMTVIGATSLGHVRWTVPSNIWTSLAVGEYTGEIQLTAAGYQESAYPLTLVVDSEPS